MAENQNRHGSSSQRGGDSGRVLGSMGRGKVARGRAYGRFERPRAGACFSKDHELEVVAATLPRTARRPTFGRRPLYAELIGTYSQC